MSSDGRSTGSPGIPWRAAAAAMVLFLCCSLFPSAKCHSAGGTSVEGIIQGVDGPNITVRGKSYNTAAVPLRSPSGRYLSPGALAVGKKVGMSFAGGVLKSIVIYDDMVE